MPFAVHVASSHGLSHGGRNRYKPKRFAVSAQEKNKPKKVAEKVITGTGSHVKSYFSLPVARMAPGRRRATSSLARHLPLRSKFARHGPQFLHLGCRLSPADASACKQSREATQLAFGSLKTVHIRRMSPVLGYRQSYRQRTKVANRQASKE